MNDSELLETLFAMYGFSESPYISLKDVGTVVGTPDRRTVYQFFQMQCVNYTDAAIY